MSIDLDIIEDNPLWRFSASPPYLMTPLDLRGVRIFDDGQKGKSKEEFNYRKEQKRYG